MLQRRSMPAGPLMHRAFAATLVMALVSAPAAAAEDGARAAEDGARAADGGTRATTLLDLSGLATLGTDRVLAVHDAKNPGENDRPRASILTLTDTPDGVTWRPVSVDWPDELGPANDLESASAIPGQTVVILAESGDDGSDFQRLFFVDIDAPPSGDEPGDGDVLMASLLGVAEWPSRAFNVESVAVAQLGTDYVLLYAERAEGNPTTMIQWAPLTYPAADIGEPTGVAFTSPAVRGPHDRPISAMEVAADGRIYVASAYDTGDDSGPFASAVWMAGWIVLGPDGPSVIVPPEPELVATLDGFKVESLAFMERQDGSMALLAGTDDEDFGGVLRRLPLER